jgi:hypothetical protein
MVTHESPVLYSVDFGECEALAALEAGGIVACFVAALERAGASGADLVARVSRRRLSPACLILRESHAVLHTWPETGTVNIDIFSCSTRLKSLEAVNELSRTSARARFRSRRYPVPTDTAQDLRYKPARNFALRGVAWSVGLFGLRPPELVRNPRGPAAHTTASAVRGKRLRKAGAADRGHARVQRCGRHRACAPRRSCLPCGLADAACRRAGGDRSDPGC